MKNLKPLFSLDPDITYLNHGSFGACPIEVFQEYQSWQTELEKQPLQFMVSKLPEYLRHSRQALSTFLNVPQDTLVFVPNATHGVNIVGRSLKLNPDDEILITNHEYGACEKTWRYIAKITGAKVIRSILPIPLPPADEVISMLWKSVTDRTKVIFLSHISSPTAQLFPVKEICSKAREHGILSIIDGAHAPGQIALNLTEIAPDFYTGNCHKWMMCPKGSAFLYIPFENQHLVEPLIVSWGWGGDSPFSSGNSFLDLFDWTGTRDPSPYLSIPSAIDFFAKYNWGEVRMLCNEILIYTMHQIDDILGYKSFLQEDSYLQMAGIQLPFIPDLINFQNYFYQKHKIEIPFIQWEDQTLLRISIQGYNSREDVNKLVQALRTEFIS